MKCSERLDEGEPTGAFFEYEVDWCDRQGAVCEDGVCLLRNEECPGEVSSFCRDGAAWDCKGEGVLARSRACEDLPCFDVQDEQGGRAVCALDATPCASDLPYAAECDGDTLVRCQAGFPVARVPCEAPAANCQEYHEAFAACKSPLCPEGSYHSQCVGSVVLICSDLGDYVSSDCAADGNYCVSEGDAALCSGSALTRVQTWIPLPAGSFQFRTQLPNGVEAVEVSVPAFQILETEVTELQFRACIYAGVCSRDALNWCSKSELAEAPAVCVTDEGAVDYCAWIGGWLPTEQEWQYALVSAGQRVPFPWGETAPNCTHAVLSDVAASDQPGCGTGGTWSACSHPEDVTRQGVCDLVGNVSELVVGERDERAFVYPIGGSFRTPSANANVLPTEPRSRSDSGFGADYIGFRCVR